MQLFLFPCYGMRTVYCDLHKRCQTSQFSKYVHTTLFPQHAILIYVNAIGTYMYQVSHNTFTCTFFYINGINSSAERLLTLVSRYDINIKQ